MIIGRSPLRITLGGGGTDLPSYYEQHGGFALAAAIDQYVYVAVHKTSSAQLVLRHSEIERVERVEDIQHPIIREALKLMDIFGPDLELTSMADLPAGSGLGSSGSFTTCLLKVLHRFTKTWVSPERLAELACHIEIERLGEPIGKQDQYIAAYGGVMAFEFGQDGKVRGRSLKMPAGTASQLEDSLVMISTGTYRSASSVLREQDRKSRADDAAMIQNLHYVKELGLRSQEALERGDLLAFGQILHEHWQWKKQRSALMTSAHIDRLYALGLANGAIGGKLIGAGGGGFLLFYTEDRARLSRALQREGLHEVAIRFDYEGAKIL